MLKKLNFKVFLPHLLALVIFAGLGMVYFYPVLQGYQLKQGDIKLHKGMSQELRSHKAKFNEEPLWIGNMFSGMPAYQVSNVKYSGNILAFFNDALKLWMPHPIGILILYMIGFYILMMCLKIDPWLAIIGAIAFAFSSYFIVIIEAGHNSKAFAIGYAPPLLGGIIAILRGRVRIGVLITAVFMGLELYANHLQITYYLVFVILAIGIGELIHQAKNGVVKLFLKRVGYALIAVFIGILPNIGNIITTYEYSKSSTRSPSELTINPDGSSNAEVKSTGLDKDYITQWSYGKEETLTLLLPNAKGGKSGAILSDEAEMDRIRKENPNFFNFMVKQYQSSGYYVNTYWGNMPFTSGPVYAGIVICFLALLALFFVKDRIVNSLLAVMILSILLSWGKNFMGFTEFFIDHVPLYNKFRAVTMILSLVELVLPILAVLFLAKLISHKDEILAQKKKLYLVGGGFIGILLILWMSPDSFLSFSSDKEMSKFTEMASKSPQEANLIYSSLDNIEELRIGVFKNDVFNGLKYVMAISLLIFLFLIGKVKRNLLLGGITTLVVLDLWLVDKQYVNNAETPGTSSRADNHFESYTKLNKIVSPYDASSADLAILNKELASNPNLQNAIESELAEKRKENPRLDPGIIQTVQFTELMRGTHYRVLNTTAKMDEDAQTAFFHKTLGGYHGAKMKKYQELIDFEVGIEHYQMRQAFLQGGPELVKQYLPQMNGINMLNAKYLIGAVKTEKGNVLTYVENPYRLGNAWLIESLFPVSTADEEITKLKELNPRKEAVIRATENANLSETYSKSPQDKIELLSYLPNKLVYSYQTSGDAFAVFSEIYYADGWNAYLNGNLVPHYKVNYILRGMEIPSGKGEIVFKFEPVSYQIGEKLTWASSVIILLLLGSLVYGTVQHKD